MVDPKQPPNLQPDQSQKPAHQFLQDWLELEQAFSSGSGEEEIGLNYQNMKRHLEHLSSDDSDDFNTDATITHAIPEVERASDS